MIEVGDISIIQMVLFSVLFSAGWTKNKIFQPLKDNRQCKSLNPLPILLTVPKKIIVRRKYLDRLMALKDDPRIKAILGPVFIGKTMMITQLKGELLISGVPEQQIATLSFDKAITLLKEGSEFLKMMESACTFDKGFLLIDSVHLVPDYREMLSEYHRTHPGISIYVTVSTNTMWKGADLSGYMDQVVIIDLYPFTFREFLERYPGDPKEVFNTYLNNGGCPFLTPDMDPSDRLMMVEGYIHIVVDRLILREHKTNPLGMAMLLSYLFANVSDCLTMKDIVRNSGIADNRTLEKYMERVLDTHILYRAEGYQMDRGMKKSAKMVFFAADTLTGHYINLRGIQPTPWRNVVVNILYTELRTRGYLPDIMLSKGEAVAMRITVGGRPVIIRTDLHADSNMKSESFSAFKSSTMDKLFLTLDPTTKELERYNHHNLVDFLLTDDIESML